MLTIANNAIDLWLGKLNSINHQLQDYNLLLDKVEQAEAQNRGTALLRQQYIEVHATLRLILASYVNQPPEKIKIKKQSHGKPYLLEYPELVFNLSHSADTLIIAISKKGQMGIDIEFSKPRNNLARLVSKCFANEEALYWHNLPDQQKISMFYDFWTKKEAFVKATGRGIALGLEQCVLNINKPDSFSQLPPTYGSVTAWHIINLTLLMNQPSLYGALVIDRTITEINWHTLTEVL